VSLPLPIPGVSEIADAALPGRSKKAKKGRGKGLSFFEEQWNNYPGCYVWPVVPFSFLQRFILSEGGYDHQRVHA
jgi:hypothetical protein